jgi:predicted nucleic acid-binding protein
VILLDTTVLVYAVGDAHPLREPCRLVVGEIGAGRLAATTTVEVIQEFAHVRARRRGRADARALALDFVDLLSPLIHPGESDLARGLDLFEHHETLGAFDAVLAAVVLERAHLTGLMSADGAFAGVAGLTHLDPINP